MKKVSMFKDENDRLLVIWETPKGNLIGEVYNDGVEKHGRNGSSDMRATFNVNDKDASEYRVCEYFGFDINKRYDGTGEKKVYALYVEDEDGNNSVLCCTKCKKKINKVKLREIVADYVHLEEFGEEKYLYEDFEEGFGFLSQGKDADILDYMFVWVETDVI